MAYNIIKYDSTDIRISNDIYFGRDLNKSIVNSFIKICNKVQEETGILENNAEESHCIISNKARLSFITRGKFK